MSKLEGKLAVVTGASRGIGRAIAIELAKEGAKLAILSRNSESLQSVARQVESFGVACVAEAVDVSKVQELELFLERIEKQNGGIDILVNNAGSYSTASVATQSLDGWRSVLETNLTAALRACKSVLPSMINSNWGRIVNISSISGKCGEAYGAAYSASKFGMIGLTQSLALEVARHAVTVNAVCPGWVMTDMALDQLNDPEWCELNNIEPADSVEIARLSVPQMRFIEPSEVASLVSYLCSDGARGITGQAINICGGLTLH